MSYEDAPVVKDGTYWALKGLYETFSMIIWNQHERADMDYHTAIELARDKWIEKNGKDTYVDEDELRQEDSLAQSYYTEMYVLDNLSTELSNYMRRLGIEV